MTVLPSNEQAPSDSVNPKVASMASSVRVIFVFNLFLHPCVEIIACRWDRQAPLCQ